MKKILNKRNIQRFIVFFVLLGISVTLLTHFFVARSEAFRFAENYLATNAKVISELGPITSDRLSFSGYSLDDHGVFGSAKFYVELVGQRDSANVYLILEKSEGVWLVRKGNLILKGGNSIQLL